MQPVEPRSRSERVLSEATFSPEARKYHVLTATAAAAFSIVGIPLLPVILLVCQWYYRVYYERLRMVLTTRDLKVHRGVLTREEKSIPLEKITDLAVYQGPLMRKMNLKGLRVETAGQTSESGALVSVVGVENVEEFRDRVLNQRDRIADDDDSPPQRAHTPAPEPASSPVIAPADNGTLVEAMHDIHETLKRIERKLDR